MLEKRVFTLHLTRLTRVSTRIFRVVSRFDTCQSFRVASWHGSNVSCHLLTRFKKLTDTNLTRNETNRFETFQPDTCHSLWTGALHGPEEWTILKAGRHECGKLFEQLKGWFGHVCMHNLGGTHLTIFYISQLSHIVSPWKWIGDNKHWILMQIVKPFKLHNSQSVSLDS